MPSDLPTDLEIHTHHAFEQAKLADENREKGETALALEDAICGLKYAVLAIKDLKLELEKLSRAATPE